MEYNLDQVATELYGKIQTRFPDIKIADESAEVLSKKSDIKKARFFEFEYSEQNEPLGTIAISLDGDDGIVIKASGDLIDEKDPDDTHRGAYQFIRSFRKFARSHMLKFEVNNLGKSNLNKRDYEFHAKSGEEPMMESKMWGTSKVSYQDLGETRLVVKHAKPVNIDLAAGRTMHIESIYIDNKAGERFRYPVRHLNGARAMAQHIGHGGNPYDAIGQHVVSLSEEMAKLRMFKGYVSRTPVVSEAMGTVNAKVIERIEAVKKQLHQLQNAKHYEAFAESFAPEEAKDIPEEIMLDWVDRLTVRSFKEELKDVFPYIYKIVDESEIPVRELDPDDLLDEVFDGDKETGTTHKGGKVTKTDKGIRHSKSDYDDGGPGDENDKPGASRRTRARFDHDANDVPNYRTDEDQFESFLNRIVEGEDGMNVMDGSPEAIQALKAEIEAGELVGDLNQSSIVSQYFNDDDTLAMIIDNTSGNDNAWPIIKAWLDQENPEIAEQLFTADDAPTDEPAEPAPEMPAEPAEPAPEMPAEPAPGAVPAEPAAPVAESSKDDDDDLPWHKTTPHDAPAGTFKKKAKSGNGMDRARALAQRFAKKGATPDTKIGESTLGALMAEYGLTPEECGMAKSASGQSTKDVAEPTQPRGDSYEDMKKFISGFYNREERNFIPGGMGMKIKVDKQFPGADAKAKARIMHDIERIDPSSSLHETNRILHLAGLKGK